MRTSVYPWMGGKFFELKHILPLIPIHEYYYEPFFGSGVIMLNKPKSTEEFANDINSRLVAFWHCLQDEKLMLALQDKCFKALDSRSTYEMEKARWKQPLPEDEEDYVDNLVERAFNFLYLVKFGFNSFPNTYYSPLTHKMFKIKNFSQTFRFMAERLPKFHERIRDVRFSNYGFDEFLEKNVPQVGKFIILDPPYYKTHQYNRDYDIKSDFSDQDYAKMRDLLEWHTDGGTYWMITCNQINKFFDGMRNTHSILIDRRACINKNEERADVKTKIIMNYDIRDTGRIIDIENEKEGDDLLI